RLLHAIAEKLDYRGVASPGDPFPGWEFAAALAEPRAHSVLSLAPDAAVVLDEPEQIRGAAERLWKRLDQAQAEPDLAAANFFDWTEFEALLASRTRIEPRELDLAAPEAAAGGSPRPTHIATRPSLAFHGNMQVAVAEGKTMVDQGYRVAFFAPTNGELE